jgi:hypothetical protein
MSEQTGGFDRLKKTIGRLISYSEQRGKERESRAIAREAVLLFANQEQQEPLATYPADSPSIYDLSQAKPGTIIRIEFNTMSFYSGMPGRDKYAWFTTGGNKDGKASVYGVIQSTDTDEAVSLSRTPKLQLTNSWYIQEVVPGQYEFAIKDALFELYAQVPFSSPLLRENTVTKLDIMSAGKAAKVPEREISARHKLALTPGIAGK